MSSRSALLLLGALLAAACSHAPPPTPQARAETAVADARNELRALIADKDRAHRADAVVLEIKAAFEQAGVEAEALRTQVEALDGRHDATADQFQAVLSTDDAVRTRRVHDLIKLRDQLARLLTAEEWKRSDEVRVRLLQLQLGPQPL